MFGRYSANGEIQDTLFRDRRHLPPGRHRFATKARPATTRGTGVDPGRLHRRDADAIFPCMAGSLSGSQRRPRLSRRPWTAVAALVAAGCASAERPAAGASPGTITLALQQRGTIGGFAVTALRVEEDSRCPAEVQCIQAGIVRLSVRIAGRARLQPVLTLARPSRLDADNWLTLCAVTPYPARPGRIRPAAYRFGFVLHSSASAPPTCPIAAAGASG